MSKRKIGGVIVSDYNHNNYGSALQAYATMKIVQDFGYDLSFIKYKKTRSFFEKLIIMPKYMISGGFEWFVRDVKTRINKKMIQGYEANQKIRRAATNAFKDAPLYSSCPKAPSCII